MERRIVVLFTSFVACILTFAVSCSAAQTPSFTVTGTDATMPTKGMGTIPFTVTSLNGYSGNVSVNCTSPSSTGGAILPICEGSVDGLSPLTADSVVGGMFVLTAAERNGPGNCYGDCTYSQARRRPFGWALAGALVLGLGFRRRLPRGFAIFALAAATLAGTVGLTGCGGGSSPILTQEPMPTRLRRRTSIRINRRVPLSKRRCHPGYLPISAKPVVPTER